MKTITQELAARGVSVAKLAAALSPKVTVAPHVVAAFAELSAVIRQCFRAARSK
jgi:hypothetical protein